MTELKNTSNLDQQTESGERRAGRQSDSQVNQQNSPYSSGTRDNLNLLAQAERNGAKPGFLQDTQIGGLNADEQLIQDKLTKLVPKGITVHFKPDGRGGISTIPD